VDARPSDALQRAESRAHVAAVTVWACVPGREDLRPFPFNVHMCGD
jgi:hypothetical protein